MGNSVRGAWKLYLVWLLVLGVVVAITLHLDSESTHFYGIADTREIVINSDNAVEISKIAVVEGQSVEKGTLLLKLTSPELTLKINQISHQLAELKATKGVSKTELISQINQLKAQRASRLSEINYSIKQLENQYRINKDLKAGLKSLKDDGVRSGAENPLKMRIAGLKKELALSLHPLNIKIKLLEQELNAPQSPIKIQVERLEKELVLLRQANKKLDIYSPISGIIGSINFKPGAKVAPFGAILTLHTRTPSFIKGYVHENVYSSMGVGQEVLVKALAESKSKKGGQVGSIKGVIVGVGARIVEYPVRLRKHPDIQTWGRELLIKIPDHNNLILGEKVMILSRGAGAASLWQRLRRTVSPGEARSEPRRGNAAAPVVSPRAVPPRPLADPISTAAAITTLSFKEIEASAVLYLKDLNRYLILSDDTPGNQPLLFLMNPAGRITNEARVMDLGKINDMEALAQNEEGKIYIAASQSHNKKGKQKRERRLLIRVKRQGLKFTLEASVDLHTLLQKAAEHAPQKPWVSFLLAGAAKRAIDIEGVFIRKGALYLGYKAPFLDGQSAILKIDQIDKVLDAAKLSPAAVSLFKTVRLGPVPGSKQRQRISDLFSRKDELFITSTTKKGGALWRMTINTGALKLLASFTGLRPEGIAATPKEDTLVLVFDQGDSAPSRFLSIKVSK